MLKSYFFSFEMLDKLLLERRVEKIAQNEKRLIDLGLENGVCLVADNSPVKEKQRRYSVIHGDPRQPDRIKQNKTRNMNVVKNYCKIKRKGKLTKVQYCGIERRLRIRMGINK